MPRPKTDPKTLGEINRLLASGKTEKEIIKVMSGQNKKISKGLIYNIKHPKENRPKLANKPRPNFNICSVMNKNKLNRLKNMATEPNPPTQRYMAKVLDTVKPQYSQICGTWIFVCLY